MHPINSTSSAKRGKGPTDLTRNETNSYSVYRPWGEQQVQIGYSNRSANLSIDSTVVQPLIVVYSPQNHSLEQTHSST